MNPAYGIILWIVIGALAGWLGSKIMGTDDKMGGIANVVVGIVGAMVGGFITRAVFGDDHGNNGFFASLGVSMLGACVVIGLAKLVFKRG